MNNRKEKYLSNACLTRTIRYTCRHLAPNLSMVNIATSFEKNLPLVSDLQIIQTVSGKVN